MCNALWQRLVDVQNANPDVGKHIPDAIDPLQKAEYWYSGGVNREFDQMMLEFSGETVGRVPLCNLLSIPDSIDQKCLAEVVKNDGCAYNVGFHPEIGAYVDIDGAV